VESYRYDNMVRQHTILHLGKLEELPEVAHKKELAKRIDDLVRQSRTGMQYLFVSNNEDVERLAFAFFEQMKLSNKIDLSKDSNRQVVHLESVSNKDVREIGTEWLCNINFSSNSSLRNIPV
jgi:hypothetical protein